MCQENTNEHELPTEQQALEEKLVKRLLAPYVPPDQRPVNQEPEDEDTDEEGPCSDFDL